MKYVDEFRDQKSCQLVVERILRRAQRRWTVMEVCGGQTHGLLRNGLVEALQEKVELLHGPGCPVCVTPAEVIDIASAVAKLPNCVLATFGDMVRVPGLMGSLANASSQGASVRTVYSPLDAVAQAIQQPDRNVIFLAVGFETTIPATALAILQAKEKKLSNFFVLTAHVRVAPAMRQIAMDVDSQVDAFLAAGHVCTITGMEDCQQLSRDFKLPIVVTGFEPLDLLLGIENCIEQLEKGQAESLNFYRRTATDEGNAKAQVLIKDVFEVVDRPWRGMGTVKEGGFALRANYRQFDAVEKFSRELAGLIGGRERQQNKTNMNCRSGEVLSGKIRPHHCSHFGTTCTPQNPLGAPMVSSEGACAAYYLYARQGEFVDRKIETAN